MSTTAAAAPPAAGSVTGEGPAGLSHKQILVVLSGLMLGMFLAALDQTIVSTAIRTIADDLKGLDQQAWATTAYLITSTISTPLYGKLSDQFGRKPFFLTAISIFVIGSVACTFSTSMYMLAGFRALQGLGAGGLMSLALTIIADIVPARERAKYQGYFLAVFGTSSVLGPVIGGFFAGQADILGIDGWRWVFLVNVPIGIAALIVVARVLNIPHNPVRHRIDWPGAVALVIGLVPLLLIAEQGRDWGWDSARAFTCYGLGVVGLIAFWFIERYYKDEALVPLRLFRSSVFSITSGAGLLIGLAMFGAIAMLPQYMQIVRGATPTESGFLMLPFVLGMMVFSIVSGQLTSRTGRYKMFPIMGSALMTGAAVLFYFRLGADTSLLEMDAYMLMFGAGLGLCMQTLTLAAQNAVPAKDVGVATSTTTTFRQLGGTLGTAIFLSLLFSTVGDKIKDAFTSATKTQAFQSAVSDPKVMNNPVNAPVKAMLQGGGAGSNASGVLQDSSFLQKIDGRLAHPFFVGFADSIKIVFLCAAVIAFVAFVIFWFMKEIPLRKMSGIQAAAADRAKLEAEKNGANVDAVETASDHVEEKELVYANGNGARGNGSNGVGDRVPATVLASTAEFSPQRGAGAHRATATASAAAGFTPPEAAIPVTGRVHRGDGAAVTGAVLTLIDPSGRQVSRATAGGDGGYHLDAPSSGRYVLIASAGAHQPEASTIVVGNNPVEHDLVLAGTASLGGTVTSQNSGDPITGATTTLADGRGEVVGAQHTDANGHYRFAELVAGEYTLVVSADAFRPNAVSVTVGGVGESVQDVALQGGARLAGVARAGADEHPVGDARITLLDAAGHVVAVTDTNLDGAYSFADLADGEYTVIASGYPPVASSLQVKSGDAGEHDVTLAHPEAGN